MKAFTSIKLQAFLETILQLAEDLDEETDTKITEIANNLDEIAQNSPSLQSLYESACDRILENYQTQSRSKFIGTLPETSTKQIHESSTEKNAKLKEAWNQWLQEVKAVEPIASKFTDDESESSEVNKYSLRGTPIVYIDPTEPVAECD